MVIGKILKRETRKAMFNIAMDVEVKRLHQLVKVQKRTRRKYRTYKKKIKLN